MGETDEPKWHVVDKSKNNNKIEKMANKSNMNKKTKRGIRREGKCKENVLKKYCQPNVQGLITTNQPQEKVEILRDLMNKERPLFLALTETWLHEHKEAETHIGKDYIPGYSMIVHPGSVPYRLGFSSYVYRRFFILILVKP